MLMSQLWAEKMLEYRAGKVRHKVVALSEHQAKWLDMLEEPVSVEDFEAIPIEHFEALFSDVLAAGPNAAEVFAYLKIVRGEAFSLNPSAREARVYSLLLCQDDEVRTAFQNEMHLNYLFVQLRKAAENYFITDALPPEMSGSRSLRDYYERITENKTSVVSDLMAIGGLPFFEEGTEQYTVANRRIKQLREAMRHCEEAEVNQRDTSSPSST